MPAESIDRLTPEEAQVAIGQLEQLAGALRSAQSAMDEGHEVWLFRKPSLEILLERVPPFLLALEDSLRHISLGRPFDKTTTKGRKKTSKRKRSNKK